MTMTIDRADWHWDGAEQAYRDAHGITGELTEEQEDEIWLLAANHISLFVRWIIERGFEGEDTEPEEVREVREGRMTCAEYLINCLDGKLWDEVLREDVRFFARVYYGEQLYLEDYVECCVDEDSGKGLY